MSLQTEFSAGIARLTLNRPDRLNALTIAMLDEMVELLQRWSVDPAIRCVVVQGAGRGFCAGYDLSGADEPEGGQPIGVDAAAAHLMLHATIPMLLRRMPKPTVARLRGPVAGSGVVIALACDLRLASRTTRIKLAFASAGRCGDPGAPYLLTRLIGSARARELFLLDEPVEAEAALQIGLVTRLFDDDALDAACEALAQQLAAGPTGAFAAMKRNLNAAESAAFEEVMATEAVANAHISKSHDAAEAASAFMARRAPNFRGY